MKAILLTVFFAYTVFSAPKCFDTYYNAALKVERNYIVTKAQYAEQSITYVYKFFPVNLFPYFYAREDTLKKYIELKSIPIYLCSYSTCIRKYTDNSYTDHIFICVLSYVLPKKEPPKKRTYTLYFLRLNPFTKIWEEERKPLVVTVKNQILESIE
jgi:hypothetical protein